MTRTARQAQTRLDFEDRLQQALVFQPSGFGIKHAPLIVAARNGELAGYVKLAEKLLVDARWLATGEESPAGIAAASRIRLSSFFAEQSERAQRALLDCLLLTPQPAIGPDICRYCGCTHGELMESCEEAGGCEWIDRAQTICSACLQEKP